MFIKCLVAVNYVWGGSLIPVVVECTEEQARNKKHHQAAIDIVIENNDLISIPTWVISQEDIIFASLIDNFLWQHADQTCILESTSVWDLESFNQNELNDSQRQQFSITENGESFCSSRKRFKVECNRCKSILHDSTNNPLHYIERHVCSKV